MGSPGIGTVGATTVVARTAVGVADALSGTRGRGRGRRRAPALERERVAADHLRLRQDLHLPHRAVQPRARAQPAVRRHRRGGAVDCRAGLPGGHALGQNVNSYGHDLQPEARFGHVRTERWAGRQLDLGSRPDLAELIRAIDGLRTADGTNAIPRLRFITSHPWDLSDRLIDAMADCPSVCEALHLPVQSGDDAVLRRMGRQYDRALPRATRPDPRRRPGHRDLDRCHRRLRGETEAQYESTLRLLERVRYDQVFAAAYSSGPARPRRGSRTTSPRT